MIETWQVNETRQLFKSLGDKLRAAFERGPGDDVVLTSAEAALLYRLLTEQLRFKFDQA